MKESVERLVLLMVAGIISISRSLKVKRTSGDSIPEVNSLTDKKWLLVDFDNKSIDSYVFNQDSTYQRIIRGSSKQFVEIDLGDKSGSYALVTEEGCEVYVRLEDIDLSTLSMHKEFLIADLTKLHSEDLRNISVSIDM